MVMDFGMFFSLLGCELLTNKYMEYPAKRDKRKRHNSAMEKDISNLKKMLESPMKTILPYFDKFLPPFGLDSPLRKF